MVDEHLSIYRLEKEQASVTFVAAYSEEHAEQIAHQLTLDAYGSARFSVSLISTLDELPSEWRDELPWTEPGKEHLYRDQTCAEIVGAEASAYDASEQHAIDQHLHGSTILRSPRTDADRALYVRFGVLRASGTVYFTTLKPIPIELRPFYLCHAIKAEEFSASDRNV